MSKVVELKKFKEEKIQQVAEVKKKNKRSIIKTVIIIYLFLASITIGLSIYLDVPLFNYMFN